MIVFKLFPAFMLFLLLAGHSLITPSQVYAGLPIWCCPCGTECSWLNLGSWFCRCRGTDPSCPYCQKNAPTMFRPSLSITMGCRTQKVLPICIVGRHKLRLDGVNDQSNEGREMC